MRPFSRNVYLLLCAALLLIFLAAHHAHAQPSRASLPPPGDRVHAPASDDVTRQQGHPPYPILFVHGLNGSDRSWLDVLINLIDIPEWRFGGTFYASLKSDKSSTKISDDVVTSFAEIENCCSALYGGDLFRTNFDLLYDADTRQASLYEGNGDGQSNSNQAAIVKQGAALERAIRAILDATGKEKIVLVGHSMGGLAIREYLQREDDTGTSRWWVDPTDQLGHHVAKAVTYGTPHRGSNLGVVFGSIAEAISGIDTQSESVRDLRYFYLGLTPGRYLYGGGESTMPTKFYNEDVNGDGDAVDYIFGLNDPGSTYSYNGHEANRFMPLPHHVSYTWITSDIDGDDDSVVEEARQWLYEYQDGVRVPSPSPWADTIQRDRCHSDNGLCSGLLQTDDLVGVLRGIDTPARGALAYGMDLNEPRGVFVDGYATAPPGYPDASLDLDTYRIDPKRLGSATVSVPPGTDTHFFLYENGHALGSASLPLGEPEALQFTTSIVPSATHFVSAVEVIHNHNTASLYSFRVDTQPLQHFEYEPHHGPYGDLDEQGFATVSISPDVPTVHGSPIDDRDEIGVFTPDGTCVGALVWTGNRSYVTAFGRDGNGLSEGERVKVRIWDRSADTEYLTDVEFSGNGRYEPGADLKVTRLDASEPIPVELASFRATATAAAVELKWTTASETDNAGFRVQRRTGSAPFRTLAFVDGRGTTREPTHYRYTDADLPPAADSLVYRLEQVDTDGTTTVSDPVSIARRAPQALAIHAVYPNPTTGSATVHLSVPEARRASLHLYDTLGRRLRTVTRLRAGRHEVSIDAARLPAGLYFVHLATPYRTTSHRLLLTP